MLSSVVAYSSSSEDEEYEAQKKSVGISTNSNTDAEWQIKSSPQNKSKTAGKDSQNRHIDDSTTKKRQLLSQNPGRHDNNIKKYKQADGCEAASLPLPSVIHTMFDTDPRQVKDEPSKHGGRIRSFEHVEGNWATFVYVPVCPDSRLLDLFTSLMTCLRPLEFTLMTDFHVTLSRTVVIRHHWIEPLMDALRENLASCASCICDLLQPKLYTNDDKTRTFVCIEVGEEGSSLGSYVAAVDRSFQEFRLQPYYQKPSFHISIGWCVGDVTSQVSPDTLTHMQALRAECFESSPDLSVLEVEGVECKTGNKVFTFPLLTHGS